MTHEFTHIYLCTIINLISIVRKFTDDKYTTVTKIYGELQYSLNRLCESYKTTYNDTTPYGQPRDNPLYLLLDISYINNTDNIITNNMNILAKYITTQMSINTKFDEKSDPIDTTNYRFISLLENLSQIAKIYEFTKIPFEKYHGKSNTVKIEPYFSYEDVTQVFEKCSICIDDNSHLTIGSLFEYLNSLNTTDNKCSIKIIDYHREQPRSSQELTKFKVIIPPYNEIIVQMNIDLANFIIDHIINMVGLLTYLIINVKNLVPDFIRIYLCFIVNLLFIIEYFGTDTYYELGKNTDLKTALSILYLVAKNHDNFYFTNPIDNINNSIKLKIHRYNKRYSKKYSISDTINTIFRIINDDLQFDTVFYNRYKNKLREIGDVINQNDNDDTIKINIISTDYSEYIDNNNNASISYLFDFLGTFIKTIKPKPKPPKIEPPKIVPPKLSTQIIDNATEIIGKATNIGKSLKTTMSNSQFGKSLGNLTGLLNIPKL
jgi:hypothetical protein